MAVTLKDIAEQTGVSPSVVSTVLSGRDNGTFVSESTRQKVLLVAEQLKYTPVRSGRPRGSRRLRRLRTEQFIGLWDPEYSPNSAMLVQQLQRALRKFTDGRGAESEDDYGLRLLIAEDLPRLDSLGIMGVITLAPLPLPREAAAASIPCVMIGEVDQPPRDLVLVHGDNFGAGRMVAEHLWQLGHRHLAFVAPGVFPRVTRQRFQGMQACWMAHHTDAKQIVPAQSDTDKSLTEVDQVRATVMALLRGENNQKPRPTAIICFDETVAAIVSQTAFELNLRIPDDLSIVAFNDTPRVAESGTPPLTTVKMPVEEIAAAAIEQLYLLHEMDFESGAERRDIVFPCELVVRKSTAELRTGSE